MSSRYNDEMTSSDKAEKSKSSGESGAATKSLSKLAAAAVAVPATSSITVSSTDEGVSLQDDPLLGCLEILTKSYDQPHSKAALKAGLPLGQDGMTPGLFIRAAERAGFTARLVKRSLSDIREETLPCVLLLKDKTAVVLTGFAANNTLKVIYPESGAESSVSQAKLAEQYIDYALFFGPAYKADTRVQTTAATASLKQTPESWLWGTVRQFRPIYVQVIIAAVFINLFALASPLFIMNVYDRVVPNNAFETLWVLASGVMIVFIFDFILRALRAYFLSLAARGVDTIVSANLFEKLMNLKLAKKPGSAGVLAGNMREFESIREFFAAGTVATLVDLPFIALYLFIIYLIGGPLVVIPLLALPTLYLIALKIQHSLSDVVRDHYRHMSQKAAILMEAVTGLETIKRFRAEGVFQKNWEGHSAQTARSNTSMQSLSALGVSFASLIANLVTVGVVVYGVYLAADGSLSLGALVAVVILAGRAMAPAAQAAALLGRYQHAKQAYVALTSFMETPEERDLEKTYLHRPRLKGHVAFKNVSFAYPGQSFDALKDISFTLQPGEKVALIGAIGSGKSTLEKLLMNLYEPTKGSITLDATDIRQIEPADLRRNIGVVPQDVQLFYGSIRDNILLGRPEATDEALLKAATIAGVTEIVRHDDQGFDRIIAEGGKSLSGGQRQAIAIARALVYDPPILVMDEPTANFDPGSEARFLEKLQKHIADKTLILVTHRYPLLPLVDRVLVLSQGKVVADGAREAVLEDLQNKKVKK